MKAFKVFARPITSWAARRALVGRNRARGDMSQGKLTSVDIDQIIEQVWQRFDQIAPEIPTEPTLGANMLVRLAALTMLIYQSLREMDIEQGYAIELVGDAVWKIYEKAVKVVAGLTRYPHRDGLPLIRQRVELFMKKFPFNPPAYQVRWYPDGEAVAFDVLHCPVASYFQMQLPPQEAAAVCEGTWCNQDYALAEVWGGMLVRTGTRAGGVEHCDFRFCLSR